MTMQATRQSLGDARWHFQHGPIDIVLQADGPPAVVDLAVAQAWQVFETVLPTLVQELPALRAPVLSPLGVGLQGPVARRMWQTAQDAAWAAPDGFVTPMVAVAGAVAQAVLQALAQPGIERAYVNNGGDIALHLAPGQSWRLGLVSDVQAALASDLHSDWVLDGAFSITHDLPVRGVATSGWRGRSFSLGIADSVTVLAETAAQADVAATLIANAVNLEHPDIVRRPANSLRDDTDLGGRLVTVDVPRLPRAWVARAVQLGLDCAHAMQQRGQLYAAFLCCQGQVAVAQPLESWV